MKSKFRFQIRVFLWLALFGSVSLVPRVSLVFAAEVPQTWLAGKDALSVDALEQIEKLLREDSESQTLLVQAMDKVGAHSMMDFLKVVRLFPTDPAAPPNGSPSSLGLGTISVMTYGTTNFGEISSIFLFRDDASIREGKNVEDAYRARIEAFKRGEGGVSAKEVLTPGYAKVAVQKNPSICLRADLTIDDALYTFVHELTHFVKFDPLEEVDMLSFKNESDFLAKRVLALGDEVDAFVAQYRAQIRKQKTKNSLSDKMKPLFNDQGDLIGTRERLAEIVLMSEYQGGTGYADHSLRGEYQARLEQSYKSEVAHWNNFAAAIENANEGLDINQRNQEKMKYNLKVYQSWIEQGARNKNTALEEKGRKGLEEAQKKIEEIERYLPAKRSIIEGYEQELKRCDGRIRTLEARLGVLLEVL
ncbi:hypothetical protein WDW86_13050 [Bdellovibrionota bacterium FG-2]